MGRNDVMLPRVRVELVSMPPLAAGLRERREADATLGRRIGDDEGVVLAVTGAVVAPVTLAEDGQAGMSFARVVQELMVVLTEALLALRAGDYAIMPNGDQLRIDRVDREGMKLRLTCGGIR